MTRWIFSISFAIGLFWLLGFILEPIGGKEPSVFVIIIVSLLITAFFSYFLFKFSPNFLKTFPASYISTTKYYILSIISSYFLLIPLCALLAYLLIAVFGIESSHNESNIFIVLFAIWFPLWWFVPVGLTIGWLFYRRKCIL